MRIAREGGGSYVTERTRKFPKYQVGARALDLVEDKRKMRKRVASLLEVEMCVRSFFASDFICRNQIGNMLSRVNHTRISRTSCTDGLNIDAMKFFASSRFIVKAGLSN